MPAKYGLQTGGVPYPNWSTAKANVDKAQVDAQANTDMTKADALQTAYIKALTTFTSVDYMMAYRVDLLGDIRTFRRGFGY